MPQNGLQSPVAQLLLPHRSPLAYSPNILCASRVALLSVILFPGLPLHKVFFISDSDKSLYIWRGGVGSQPEPFFLGKLCGVLKAWLGPFALYEQTVSFLRAGTVFILYMLCPQHAAYPLTIVYLAQTGLPHWIGGKESACHCKRHRRQGLILGLGRFPGGGHGSPLQ